MCLIIRQTEKLWPWDVWRYTACQFKTYTPALRDGRAVCLLLSHFLRCFLEQTPAHSLLSLVLHVELFACLWMKLTFFACSAAEELELFNWKCSFLTVLVFSLSGYISPHENALPSYLRWTTICWHVSIPTGSLGRPFSWRQCSICSSRQRRGSTMAVSCLFVSCRA